MKPRITIAQSQACTDLPLVLTKHDERLFLECEGRQVDGAHLGHAVSELITMMSQPFRPARQPRILFLGLGFGHGIQAALAALPQEKASFVVFPEAQDLPAWLDQHLEDNPLGDDRVIVESATPFALIPKEYAGSQGIVADLDHLEALAPKRWDISSEVILNGLHDRLKVGGLLGLISTRPINGLEKLLRKLGFQVALEIAPLSAKSKKTRTLYVAKKGHYQRSH